MVAAEGKGNTSEDKSWKQFYSRKRVWTGESAVVECIIGWTIFEFVASKHGWTLTMSISRNSSVFFFFRFFSLLHLDVVGFIVTYEPILDRKNNIKDIIILLFILCEYCLVEIRRIWHGTKTRGTLFYIINSGNFSILGNRCRDKSSDVSMPIVSRGSELNGLKNI